MTDPSGNPGSTIPEGDPPRAGLSIPIGSLVSVCRADDLTRRWQAHRTRRGLTFAAEYRTAHVRGSSGAVIFREGDWLILTRWKRMKRLVKRSEADRDRERSRQAKQGRLFR